MNVHKSHTKRDLIILFESLKVYINPEYTKREIIEDIDEYVNLVVFSETIPNLTALKDKLRHSTSKNRLVGDEKQDIMLKAKKIISYAMNDYELDDLYNTHQEVYLDCLSIYRYGDIPTIRRALSLYNKSPYKFDHINPQISTEVQELLKEKELLKKKKILKFKINKGKFVIDFPY